jgi:2-hydroxychromene-2-carboxylate isomerase
MDSVRFYFSFRSPYAWLAFHRINHLVEGCPVNFEYIPISPSETFQNATSTSPAKRAYIREDVTRFAEAYGLAITWPEPFDTEWIGPYAAYLYAETQGLGCGPVPRARPTAIESCSDSRNAVWKLAPCQ